MKCFPFISFLFSFSPRDIFNKYFRKQMSFKEVETSIIAGVVLEKFKINSFHFSLNRCQNMTLHPSTKLSKRHLGLFPSDITPRTSTLLPELFTTMSTQNSISLTNTGHRVGARAERWLSAYHGSSFLKHHSNGKGFHTISSCRLWVT